MSDVISVDKFYSKSTREVLTKIKYLAEREAIESSKLQKVPKYSYKVIIYEVIISFVKFIWAIEMRPW